MGVEMFCHLGDDDILCSASFSDSDLQYTDRYCGGQDPFPRYLLAVESQLPSPVGQLRDIASTKLFLQDIILLPWCTTEVVHF